MAKSFYVSTPIYYVNDVPHIGHAYTTVACDALARYKRAAGSDVFFLTGTDEHGQKVEKAAAERGEAPIDLADRVVTRFQDLWKTLQISNTRFLRTSEPAHRRAVEEIFRRLLAKGDVYLGEYEDWYCTPCETFWTETQLIEGNCPDCNRPTEKLKEPSYFFRMSRYQDALLRHIEEHADFVQPVSRRNEILAFVKEGLRDLSVSRTSFSWGIPVPEDPKHVVYVWFDALTNYVTGVGFPDDPAAFSKYWPCNVHVIGKDILRFHAVYWPTFLLAAGLPLPQKVFAHGWWTVEGKKMSKSLGNVVDPAAMAAEYGADAFRYFMLREVPFGLDGDFSREALIHRINSDLANDLGNLVSRILAMLGKYRGGVVPRVVSFGSESLDEQLREGLAEVLVAVDRSMEELAFQKALSAIWAYVGRVNRFVDATGPWALAKEPEKAGRLDQVLYNACEALRAIGLLVFPFMPGAGREIWKRLAIPRPADEGRLEELEEWGGLPAGTQTERGQSLFPRIDRS